MQKSLLELDLRFEKAAIPFCDELAEKLHSLTWDSESFDDWLYDENDEAICVKVTLHLAAVRAVDRRGRPHLYLARQTRHSRDDQGIDDLIPCENMSELEQLIETEKERIAFTVENMVLFDGRYWWHWEEESGKVVFTERFTGNEHDGLESDTGQVAGAPEINDAGSDHGSHSLAPPAPTTR
jgi:hypothetical protein